MNKLLGLLNTILLAPNEELQGGGGASEESPIDEGSFYNGPKGVKIKDAHEAEQEQEETPKGKRGQESEDFSEGSEEQEQEENEDFESDEEGQSEEQDEEGQEETEPEKHVRIHPEDLARLAPQRQQQQQEQRQELTPEQKKALLNPVEITDELAAQMVHEDANVRKQALAKFAADVAKNAFSMSRLLLEQRARQFEQTLSPIVQAQQEQATQRTRQEFYSQHKDLAKYDIVVKAAAAEVIPTNADGSEKSRTQIFKEVAILSRKKLQALGVNIQQPNANHGADGQRAPQGRQVPQGARFAPSGRSGGDQHSGKGKPNNADADIYAR